MFDLSKLPEAQKAEAQRVIDGCDFPWERCRTSYVKESGASTENVIIQVQRLEGSNRAQWSDQGYITVDDREKGAKFRQVLAHEMAHTADKLGGLRPEDRHFIDVVLHTGKMDDHPWLQEHGHEHGDDYVQRIGEAWASAFIWAYTNENPGPFVEMFKAHRVNTDMARMVRAFMTPDLPARPRLNAAKPHRIVEVWEKNGAIYENAVPAPDWVSNMVEKAKRRGRKVVLR